MNDYVTGSTVRSALQAAVKQADPGAERTRQRCLVLRAEIAAVGPELEGLQRDIRQVTRELEHLRTSRSEALGIAAAGALSAAVPALGSAARAASLATRLARAARGRGRLNRGDLIQLVPVVGGLYTAAASLRSAARDNADIKQLASELQSLASKADDVNRMLRFINDRYGRLGCDSLLPGF